MSPQTLRSILSTASEKQRWQITRRTGMSAETLAGRDVEHLAPWIKRAIADALELPEDELFRGGRR